MRKRAHPPTSQRLAATRDAALQGRHCAREIALVVAQFTQLQPGRVIRRIKLGRIFTLTQRLVELAQFRVRLAEP